MLTALVYYCICTRKTLSLVRLMFAIALCLRLCFVDHHRFLLVSGLKLRVPTVVVDPFSSSCQPHSVPSSIGQAVITAVRWEEQNHSDLCLLHLLPRVVLFVEVLESILLAMSPTFRFLVSSSHINAGSCNQVWVELGRFVVL